jgi:signal transduction histidine kinase
MSVATYGVAVPGRIASRISALTRGDAMVAPGPYVLGVLLVAGLYYGSARLGYAVGFSGPVAAIVWLPVGIGIAFLTLFGMSFWPGVLAGDIAANVWTSLPPGGAVGQSIGNMLEVLIPALLIRRLMRSASPLDTVGGVIRLLLALAAGITVSALVGPTSLVLAGTIQGHSFPSVARTWWLGDMCGALVVVPLALAFARRVLRLTPRRRLEAVVLLVVVACVSEIASRSHQPLTYLVFPALFFAAVRFGQQGATVAVAVSVGVTVWATTHYQGPFVYESITRTVLTTQLFVAVAAVSTLVLAALVTEREEFAERLGASRMQILTAADNERRRIERNLHDGAQQRLVALAVRLRLASDTGAHPAAFAEAEAELALAIDELRELAQGTHPSILTQLGLADAVRSVAARSTVPVTTLELPHARVDRASEAAAYYVLSEAVANTQKHANASALTVRVAVVHHVLHIEVADDGIGGATEREGSGLAGLRDRVEAVGGTFSVKSRDGLGTRVMATIPVSE